MIKTKYKRILVLSAAFIILFVFFTFPASAYSNVSDYDSSSGEIPYSVSAPGSIDVEVVSYTLENTKSTYYSNVANFNPIIVDYDYSYTEYTQVKDTFAYGNWSGYTMPISTDIEPYGDGVNYYGTAEFWNSSYRFIPTGDLYDLNPLNFYVVMHLRDFYCWNYNFNHINTDNELSVTFNYEDADLRVAQLVVHFSVAGSDVIDQVIIDASLFDDLSNGIVNITPELLGLHDEDNLLVYIFDCEIHFTNIPALSTDPLFDFNSTYTLNPYVNNFVPDSENPALPLMPFATWLGDAVSGFMDFELYRGFSLGGIFVTIISFLCVVWFLKLVAGG